MSEIEEAEPTRNELIPVEEWIFVNGDCLKTDSHTIAKAFGKEHSHVLRDIRSLITKNIDFGLLNFKAIGKVIAYRE